MAHAPETQTARGPRPSSAGGARPPGVDGGRVGGRYRLTEPLGRGGFGDVWRAEDEATGVEVAVKLLRPRGAAERSAAFAVGGLEDTHTLAIDLPRVRRETAALRLLRLPGVVRLLDDGVHEGTPFLVMELVDGERFPGPGGPRAWSWIGPRVERLLAILRAVHAQGIVHRDLKPANVLVRGEEVVVLDFGIARGEALGGTITERGAAIGTLRYAAPEQIEGRRADARADLYAVGVMAFEALVGAPPFPPGSELARLTTSAPPIASRAREVPPAVATVIDHLLARDPRRRPRSADDVLAALGGGPARTALPWLGRDNTVRALVVAASEGRAIDLGGGSGSGRTRTLVEAVTRLRAAGREVEELRPGKSALESLAPVLGAMGPATPDAAPALRERLAAGLVIVADDAAQLDWLTRSLLQRERGAGAVVRVVDGEGDVAPVGLEEADLAALFHGPELVLHLPTDGARALFARTGGAPGRVAEEVDAWVAAGLARWDEGRLHVDRAGLERVTLGVLPAPALPMATGLDGPLDELLAWVQAAGGAIDPARVQAATGLPAWEVHAELEALAEVGAVRVHADRRVEARVGSEAARDWTEADRRRVHAALAGATPPGAPGRVAHLLASGDDAGLAAEAVLWAERGIGAAGGVRVGEIVELLRLALAGARAAGLPEAEIVRAYARSALADGSVPVLRAAAADLARSAAGEAAAAHLAAWALAQAGKVEEALAGVQGVAPTGDEGVDVYRHAMEVRALLGRGVDIAAAHVEAALGPTPDTTALAGDALTRRRAEWLGQVRYLQGRFTEAAALHAAVAEAEPEPHRRTAALINAALGRRECGELALARTLADDAVTSAAAARLPGLEAHARSVLRSVLYRMDAAGEPDEALCEAIGRLGIATATAPACLTEAAVAWRRGELPAAARLATKAAETWEAAQTPNGAVLAWALAAAAGAPVDGEALLRRAKGLPGLVRVQVGALLGMAGIAAGREMARAECGTLAHPAPERRESVLSVNEAARIAVGGSG